MASIEYVKGNYKVSEILCDSVLQNLSKTQKNGLFIRALNFKAKATSALGNISEANKCVERAFQIALAIKDDYSISSCYYYKGVFSAESGKYDESIRNLLEAKKISENLADKINISAVQSFLGLSYSHVGKYAEAIDFINESIIIRSEIGDKRGLANSFLNMNKVYTELNDNFKRLEYENKSLEICEELGDQQCISGRLMNIGDIYFLEGNYKKALAYQLKAFQIAKKIGVKNRVAEIHYHVAQIYNAEKKFQLASAHVDSCIKMRNQSQDNEGLGSANILKAKILVNLNLIKPAQNAASLAIKIAEKFDLIHVKRDAHEILGKIYEDQGNFKQAFYHLKKFQSIKDSLFNIEKSKVFIRKELEKKYQINEINNNKIQAIKELELRNQKERLNQFIWASIILILALLIVIYLFYLKYKSQKKINMIVTENQELNSQITTLEKQSIFSQTIATIAHELNTPLAVVYAGNNEQTELGNSLLNKWKESFHEKDLHIINKGIEVLNLPPKQTSAFNKRKQAEQIFSILQSKNYFIKKNLEKLSMILSEWEKETQIIEDLINEFDSAQQPDEILFLLNTIHKQLKINLAIDHSIFTSKSVLQELNEIAENQLVKSKLTKVYLLAIIQKVITLKGFNQMKDIHFEIKILEDASMLIDEKELIQIVTQLIQNMLEAVEFNDHEKVISICHFQTEDLDSLEFSNNGLPIPTESIHKIFDRFFTTKDKNKHRGLGLSIVKNTVESYGGSLSVTSNAEKTCFSFSVKK